MKTKIDALGRVVVPKALRDALGLTAGTAVDVSLYGYGLHVAPLGRTARLRHDGGRLVADSTTEVTDEVVFGLVEFMRK